MKASACLILPAIFAQALNPLPRELLEVSRQLTSSEIAIVLDASRHALTAKTFRLTSVIGGQGADVLMGSVGQPKMIRGPSTIEGGIVSGIVPGSSTPPTKTRWREDFTLIVEYTGRPARHCDGSVEQSEMVIDYTRRGSAPAWTVRARRRDARDSEGYRFTPAFEMLRGAVPVTSGERRRIGDRWARAFVSPWSPPADPAAERPLLTGDPIPNVAGSPVPNNATQSLWIDTELLLPLRWEVSAAGGLRHSFDFGYGSIDLRPPEGVDAPQCIR